MEEKTTTLDRAVQSERRKNPRHKVNFQVDFLESDVKPLNCIIQGKAFNISPEGLGLKIDYDVPLGSHVSLAIYYNGYDSVCLGEMVWKKSLPGATLYGIHIESWSYLEPELKYLLDSSKTKDISGNPFTYFFKTLAFSY